MIKRVEERPIRILLNTNVDEAFIKNSDADVIMLAIGSEPNLPPIPGIEKTLPAQDAYGKGSELGKNVVVLGGGMVGAENCH